MRLPDAGGAEGVTLKLFTDPTGSTLLLTNNGSLSVVVLPPADGGTTLAQAPYANPSDKISVLALEAVISVARPNAVPGIPGGVPYAQVYFVPPGWSVCGTSSDVNQAAQVRYLRDKASSATYYTVKSLGDELVKRVTPKAISDGNTLVKCAQDMTNLLSKKPNLQDITLYTDVIGGANECHSSYKTLLGEDAVKAADTEKSALSWLDQTPRLLEESKLLLALVHE